MTTENISTEISTTTDAPAPAAEQTPSKAEVKRIDFAKRFKPCSLIMFYAHGHRVNDYRVTEKEATLTPEGAEVSSWRTTKTVLDPENSKLAMSLRSKFIAEVCKLGSQYGSEKLVFVNFDRADDVEALKARWAAEVKAFNAQSPVVKINFGILPPLNLTGENEYMLGNLLEELKGTMDEMKQALENADYKGVRDVVGRLKGFVTLVPDKQASLITAAIADARKQARSIKARLEKKGEEIAKVQETISTAQVDLAVAACIGDDFIVQDGPSANDLMEAQAQEFCAALQDGADEQEDEEPVVEPAPAPEPAPPVAEQAPVVDDAQDEGPVGYVPGDVMAAFAADSGSYWV